MSWIDAVGTIGLVALVTGCGGGAGGITSIPGNQPVMALSVEQDNRLCADFESYETHHLSRSGLCKFRGLTVALTLLAINSTPPTDADLQSACMNAVTQCDATPLQPPSTCSLGDTSTCAAVATVDDVSRCVVDDVAATNAALDAIPPCASLTQDWLNANGSTAGTATTPASCTALAAGCPDVRPPGL